MINKNSKSYPYLGIANYYSVPYANVLEYSESIKGKKNSPPYSSWKVAVWMLENAAKEATS